jgi:DNA processing protein
MEPPGEAPETAGIDDATRRDWLRLIRSENVGPITFRQLLARHGSASAALDALPELARRAGLPEPRVCTGAEAEAELDRLAAIGARAVALGEPDYPLLLAAIPDPPPVIAMRGDPSLLGRPTIAIVGARNASGAGYGIARDLAAELGRAGFTVVSGLARGIDTAAHRGALASGTAAAVAGGIDVAYPPRNADLHETIATDGVALAEHPPGTRPTGRHFPSRNRLVSGLSLGVVLIEAAERSGSLITARLALEQGREVMAVPGSPLDPRSRGSNRMIADGAGLIQDPDDVIAILAPLLANHRRAGALADGTAAEPRERLLRSASSDADAPVSEPSITPNGGADGRDAIAEKLGPTPVAVDELVRQCGLTPSEVLTILLELEVGGRLERHPGNKVSLL